MGIQLAIPKETKEDEKRVAVSPETVKRFVANGATVTVQSNAGENATYTDSAYKDAGAKITESYSDTVKNAHVILKVQAPDAEELKDIKKGALLIAMLAPFTNKDILKDCAQTGIDAFSMEFVPRISRAQSMDVLSSQSNLAGYKAVLDATEFYPHAMPMMMTAAGTVPPAKVFVMGAGVAGLQAIATARRLGAIVSATDVRPVAKEQVESLGASFIAVEDEEFKQAETAGGYAKEMSAEYKKKQAELVEKHIAKQDIVITTALIPGRPAPKLISKAMVKSMKPGSVIVDLAVEAGGNCAAAEAGKVVVSDNVTIIGHLNIPSRLAADASALYAKNLLNLMNLIIDKESKALNINWEDEIIQGVCMTRDGKIVHPNFGGKPKAPAKTEEKSKKEKEPKEKKEEKNSKPESSGKTK
ncbi:MAG: Re/Si-specific NAD(P)(+) transhydrogenase subunit alpha [Alphaproteobacteria bacterium]|nr:Re/Si-specific NAD(P)(+) transhydrogenase subunit alpha [Alphaproteobacteria bacterium]